MDNASEVFSTIAGGNTVSYAQNPFNTNRAERGNSGIDFPNLFGLAFVYDLPFAKGQQGFAGKMIGGWQLNATYRYSSGQPYTTIQFNQFDLGTGNLCDPSSTMSGTYSACRPILLDAGAPLASSGRFCDGTTDTCSDSVGNAEPFATLVNFTDPCFAAGPPADGGCAVSPISTAHWLLNDVNAAEFYGTPYKGASRNSLRGQTISSASLGVFKDTKLGEKVTLQFQAQAFNVLNRQFRGVPDPVLDDVASGTFQNNFSNSNGGASSSANLTYDGIGRRRLLFGLKVIF